MSVLRNDLVNTDRFRLIIGAGLLRYFRNTLAFLEIERAVWKHTYTFLKFVELCLHTRFKSLSVFLQLISDKLIVAWYK